MSDKPVSETTVATGGESDLIEAARRQAEQHQHEQTMTFASPPAASPGGTPVPVRVRGEAPIADSIPGYEILKEIHRGGQGVVYQAIHKATKKRVAVKVMREGPFASPREKARFDREVQILAQLKHPNIVAVHDSGSAAGVFFYVMDYISGYPLDQWIAQRAAVFAASSDKGSRTKGPAGVTSRFRVRRGSSIDETLQIFTKICAAVNAAHLCGVTHRDLKPGNIVVGSDGEPYILDFGLAKLGTRDDDEEVGRLSVTGQFIGSLPWASPEQAEGVPDKIDLRTDVYSLGVILYQMLTGKFPYEVIGNIRDVLNNILNAEPARPSTVRRQINDEVETIILKCLAKERERRYQSAGELGRDLERYLAGEPVEAKRDSTWYVMRKLFFRNRQTAAVGVVVLVILLSCVGISGYYYSEVRQEELRRKEKEKFLGFQSETLSLMEAKISDLIRQPALGWFLVEWHAGRTDRAAAIREKFSKNSPQYAVTEFLLDDSYPFERLVAQMPPGSHSLALFAQGERHQKAGRLKEAIGAFESMNKAETGEWLWETAQARLEQLRGASPPE